MNQKKNWKQDFEDWRRRNLLSAWVGLILSAGLVIWAVVDPVLPNALAVSSGATLGAVMGLFWLYRKKF